jgi:hypothetical protein
VETVVAAAVVVAAVLVPLRSLLAGVAYMSRFAMVAQHHSELGDRRHGGQRVQPHDLSLTLLFCPDVSLVNMQFTV